MNDNVEKTEGSAGVIVLYQPDESITMEVRLDASHDTVWLNRHLVALQQQVDSLKNLVHSLSTVLKTSFTVDEILGMLKG